MRIREVEDFQNLRETWNFLLKKNLLGDNVFLTWEWLSTWWKHFGKKRKLLLLVVEDRKEIIAIAPLMLSRYRLPIFGTIKKIEFVGTKHSDYNNFIILKKGTECLKFLVDYLRNTPTDWDWIELKEIPEDTKATQYLNGLFLNSPSRLKFNKRVCNLCPYISLPNSFETLLSRLKKNLRQNLRKYLRRISAEYKIEFKRYDEASFSVKEAMHKFIELHEARWNIKGKPGVFGKNALLRNFHLDIARIFDKKGWLGLYFLIANDEPIATQYTFEYKAKIYYYLSGFDPYYAPYSVGNLITMFILKRAIKNGFKEYDMLRGHEPYKKYWTTSYRKNFEVRLIRDNILSKFYNWLTWSDVINSLAGRLKLSLKEAVS